MVRAMCRAWKLYIAQMQRDYAKSSPIMDGRISISSAQTVRLPLGSSLNTQSVNRISNERRCDSSRRRSKMPGCRQRKKLTYTIELLLMKAVLNGTERKAGPAPTANAAAG